MLPRSEFFADETPVDAVRTAPAFYGQRPAVTLGACLVFAVALMTLLRWTGQPASVLEKVVQQPIPADAVTGSPRADFSAPDPGDAPP